VAPGEFGGRVVSAEDGRPIARAALTFLHEGAAISTESDESGRFRVTAAAGAYELASAQAKGFAPFEPQLGHSPIMVWGRAGGRIGGETIYLVPGIEITVAVQKDKDKPIPGAEVRVFEEVRGPAEAPVVRTDERGEVKVSARPGDVVEARAAGFVSERAHVDLPAQTAKRVTLRLARGADHPRLSITGRVVDARGGGVDGALVEGFANGMSDKWPTD